jgi:tetratricopeptide (TPR) repeat protein
MLLQEQGKLSESEPYRREALDKSRRVLGEEHPDTLIDINSLGKLLQELGKLSEAEVLFREAAEKSRRVLGDEHPSTLIAIYSIGSSLVAQGKHAEAAKLLVPFESASRKAFTGDNSHRLASFLMNLGKARTGMGEFAGSEAVLLEARPIFVKTRGPKHKETRECTRAVIDLYNAWDAADRGKGYDAKAAEWRMKLVAAETVGGDSR